VGDKSLCRSCQHCAWRRLKPLLNHLLPKNLSHKYTVNLLGLGVRFAGGFVLGLVAGVFALFLHTLSVFMKRLSLHFRRGVE